MKRFFKKNYNNKEEIKLGKKNPDVKPINLQGNRNELERSDANLHKHETLTLEFYFYNG